MTVSYFEWAQNRGALSWTPKLINGRLREADPGGRRGCLGNGPMPTASIRGGRRTPSPHRVAEATVLRGLYP